MKSLLSRVRVLVISLICRDTVYPDKYIFSKGKKLPSKSEEKGVKREEKIRVFEKKAYKRFMGGLQTWLDFPLLAFYLPYIA